MDKDVPYIGIPVRAIVANLRMEVTKEQANKSAATSPKTWNMTT